MSESKEAFVGRWKHPFLGIVLDAITERRSGNTAALWLERAANQVRELMGKMAAEMDADVIERFVSLYPQLDQETRNKIAARMRESLKKEPENGVR